ncbi:TIR domain-containing protein [Tsuneonella mangrovi]|uniref:TIR domain-containing protein n=1 Tax=Tsuneonella mangrovi TaxID=1982042 RepID=UPI001470B0DF|nr:TIR domain-containing protein [Tsuneonella mangrovi]
MSEIFLSYARADRERIASLAAALEAQGSSVWWDRLIEGGSEFAAVIEEQLEAASYIIVAWSQHSLHSHWVRDEAEYARTQGKLVPISLDGVLPPMGFRQMHALDFSGWRGGTDKTEFIELARAVGAQSAGGVSEKALAEQAARSSIEVRQPAIEVLPFENHSTDEELGFLAEGLAEDVSSIIASDRHFCLVTANGQTRAEYRVEGSLRRMGSKTRINVRLVDPVGGKLLWSDKFDADADAIFENSDEMAGRISAGSVAEVKLAEAHRAERLPPEMQGPWETAIRTWVSVFANAGRSHMERTVNDLQKSLQAFPDFAINHALLSWYAGAFAINGMYEDEELGKYLELAQRHLDEARRLAGNDIATLIFIGAAESYSGLHARSIATLEAVLARDPFNAEAMLMISIPYAYEGRWDDAWTTIERVAELAPNAHFTAGQRWYQSILFYLAGDYAAALPGMTAFREANPSYGYVGLLLAIMHYTRDESDEAKRNVLLVKQTNPQLRPEKIRDMMLNQPDSKKGERDYALVEQLWNEVSDPAEAAEVRA